jgi:mxaK protein
MAHRLTAQELRRPFLWLLLLGGLTLAALDGMARGRVTQLNQRIEQAWRLEPRPNPDADPAWRVAHAIGLLAAGHEEEALNYYSQILADPHLPKQLATVVYYNLGNVYLRRAMTEFQAARLDLAFAKADRAKTAYRKALAHEPEFWDAKYNLETALILRPDLPPADVGVEAGVKAPKDAQTDLFSLPAGHP